MVSTKCRKVKLLMRDKLHVGVENEAEAIWGCVKLWSCGGEDR